MKIRDSHILDSNEITNASSAISITISLSSSVAEGNISA